MNEKQPKENNETLSKEFLIRYPIEWHVELEKIAKKNCESVSTVMRRAIKQFVAREIRENED